MITRSKLFAIRLADDLLADRFAGMKGGVLPHVAEVWRDKNEPPAAISPKRFRGEQQREKLVVRTVERRINNADGRSRPRAHAQFAIREMHGLPSHAMARPDKPPIGGHRLHSRANNGWQRCSRCGPPLHARRIADDLVTGINFGRRNREFVFRGFERVNAIDRLAFLDAVADFLENPDAGALCRSARRPCGPGD